jgi:hypothetical protein
VSTPEASPPIPLAFLVVVFATAIAVGGLIAYLGFTGQLGGPIP